MQNLLLILYVTCSTIGSQLLVKAAVLRIARRVPMPTGADWLLAAMLSPLVWAAVAVQGVGFVVWMVVVSRMKLGVAFATAGAFFYILMALASWQIFGERLVLLQWCGIGLISLGVMLLMAGQAT